MESFEAVVSEGTVNEKRRFIRAFVQRIEIAAQTQQTRLLLRDLCDVRHRRPWCAGPGSCSGGAIRSCS